MPIGTDEECDAWVKEAFGIDVGDPGGGASDEAQAVAGLEKFSDRASQLAQSLPRADVGSNAWARPVRGVLTQANALARRLDFTQADAKLNEAEKMIRDGRAGAGKAGAGSPGGAPAALEDWVAARAEVVASLKQLEASIRAMRHPKGNKAIIQVMSISANLTKEPSSKAQLAELRQYLAGDEIIDCVEQPNGFGVPITIRKTLLPVIDRLDGAIAQ